MKQKHHSVDQIISKLRRADVELGKGKKVPEVCKLIEIAEHTYDWTNLSDKQLTNFSAAGVLSVAISGDIAVVGDQNVNSNTGEVKLFSRISNGNWNPLTTLTAGDAATGDWFGSSVGISGDTVLVGAYGDESNTGSAYLFTKPGGGWTTTNAQTAKLTASDSAADDYFGHSVGIDGATGRVIVGNFPDVGAASAYIYQAVPEPSTALLLCLGLMALATGRWNR